MTKYILNSGNLGDYPEKAPKFYEELFKDQGTTPVVLWCFFATEAERRTEKFEKYTTENSQFYPDDVSPTNIHATVEDFNAQVAAADIISIHGGDTLALQLILKDFDLEALFLHKTIAGHSAGANNISAMYWSPGKRLFNSGFGLVPCKFLAHFNSSFGSDDPRGPIDWDAAYMELEAYGDTNLPIYALEEGDYVVFEA